MRQPTFQFLARFAAPSVLPLVLLACLAGAASPASSISSRTHVSARAGGPTDPEVASFVKLMNAHRRSLRLSPLVWDGRVAAVAKAHSQDMADRDYFSHTTPDGLSTWDRLANRGATYSRAGENIAWGHETGRAVFRAWLNSPGHRTNIEQDSYTHHGVGKAGTYWTHVFLRPRTRTAASR